MPLLGYVLYTVQFGSAKNTGWKAGQLPGEGFEVPQQLCDTKSTPASTA